MKLNEYRLKDKSLCLLVILESIENEDDFLDSLALLFEIGVGMLILQSKIVSARTTIHFCKKIRELCSLYNVIFILSSRVDIAQIIEADGVQLSQEDIAISKARMISSDKLIFGLSNYAETGGFSLAGCCSCLNELLSTAKEQDADYVFFDCSDSGFNVDKIQPDSSIPVFAKISTIQDVLRMQNVGITRFAIEMDVKNPENTHLAVRELLSKLQ